MSAKTLTTVATDLIETYGNTARNVIGAYRAGNERVVVYLEQRWNSAFKQAASQLSEESRGNAQAAQNLFGGARERRFDPGRSRPLDVGDQENGERDGDRKDRVGRRRQLLGAEADQEIAAGPDGDRRRVTQIPGPSGPGLQNLNSSRVGSRMALRRNRKRSRFWPCIMLSEVVLVTSPRRTQVFESLATPRSIVIDKSSIMSCLLDVDLSRSKMPIRFLITMEESNSRTFISSWPTRPRPVG